MGPDIHVHRYQICMPRQARTCARPEGLVLARVQVLTKFEYQGRVMVTESCCPIGNEVGFSSKQLP